MNELVRYQKRQKVLFTGRGELVIDNLMEHMPDRYQLEKCPATGLNILQTIDRMHPQVVVICLQNETRDTLDIFELLGEQGTYEEIPVIVIGKKEDCDSFNRKLTVKNLAVFERPFDRDGFLIKLEEFEQLSWEQDPIDYQELDFDRNTDGLLLDENFFGVEDVQESLLKRVQMLTLLKGRKNILVVDDDVRMLNLIKLHLQDLYDITVVPSGKLALKYLDKKAADLVLLDYLMPDMDGSEVLKQIRENKQYTDLPVIFLTSVSDSDLVKKGLEFRPNGYILKPATREVLLERVTEILLKI